MHESNRLRQIIHKPWQAHHPKMLAELQSKHQTELPSTAAIFTRHTVGFRM